MVSISLSPINSQRQRKKRRQKNKERRNSHFLKSLHSHHCRYEYSEGNKSAGCRKVDKWLLRDFLLITKVIPLDTTVIFIYLNILAAQLQLWNGACPRNLLYSDLFSQEAGNQALSVVEVAAPGIFSKRNLDVYSCINRVRVTILNKQNVRHKTKPLGTWM